MAVEHSCLLHPAGCFINSSNRLEFLDPSFADASTAPQITLNSTRPGMWGVYGLSSVDEQEEVDSEVLQLIILNTAGIEGSEPGDHTQLVVDLPLLQSLPWERSTAIAADHDLLQESGMIGVFCGKDSISAASSLMTAAGGDGGGSDTSTNNWFPVWYQNVFNVVSKHQLGVTGDVAGPVGCVWSPPKKASSVILEVVLDKFTSEVWACRLSACCR